MSAKTRRTRAGRTPASKHGLAAGPAAAGNRLRAVGQVVVGELFTLLDIPRGANPDRVAVHLGVAVRLAGVIDEAGNVAAHRGIADVEPIELEAPDVPLLQVPD